MVNSIDNFDDRFLGFGDAILKILLTDQTTHRNIIWATDNYEHLGNDYHAKYPILINLITGENVNIIQPRTMKAKARQTNRTKDKAEVFTPSWMCNEQNNLVDEQWFGRKNVFNIPHTHGWTSTNTPISFQEKHGKRWTDYVDLRRLEITCGEAPYLVSRYDTVTGNSIEPAHRIGLLDRKLRVVNENTIDEENWFRWTVRAFQSIYGFEYQGDSLLLARENLLYTFLDNLEYKFHRSPTFSEIKEIAYIISWNIWQMDGMTYTVPFGVVEEQYQQMKLKDYFDEKGQYLCKIRNWRCNKTILYASLIKN